jgi:rSAM/selenodomain-associated transferase 1
VTGVTVLVVAKAPVPGLAKTRLAARIGPEAAAEIAAAALLDTLDAVAASPVASRVVAFTGELRAATRGDELRDRLADFTVIDQRGKDFADRLANAHADAFSAAGAQPVLQIGMDTPQVTAHLLADCAQVLLGAPAVLGMAADGGWWVLGVRTAGVAEVLRGIPMSRPDTGALTLTALRGSGIEVRLVEELRDVDTIDDVDAVRRVCAADSRFALAARAVEA